MQHMHFSNICSKDYQFLTSRGTEYPSNER